MSSMHSVVSSALTDYASVVQNLIHTSEHVGSSISDALDIQPHLVNFGQQFQSEYHLLRYLKDTRQIVMPCAFNVVIDEVRYTLLVWAIENSVVHAI